MSERYSKLFSLPENLYAQGAPIMIAAGSLLKDSQSGKIIAQIKLQNLCPQEIKAVTVALTPFDTAGGQLGDAQSYQYLDLQAKRDSFFGQKTPIPFADATTRSFAAAVTEVIFRDNSIWRTDGQTWEPLPKAKTLSVILPEQTLVEQYWIQNGRNYRYAPTRMGSLWRCACCGLNQAEEEKCHLCGKALADLENSLDVDTLREASAVRLAKEKAAAEKAEKKNAWIAAIAAVVAIVAAGIFAAVKFVVIPNRDYKAAMALYESGDYEGAIAAFQAMDGYKDSEEKVVEIQYAQAERLLSGGKPAQAALAFNALGDYADARIRCLDAWDEAAIRETVSVEGSNTVGLKVDGTVVAAGYNKFGQCDVSSWTDIISVSTGGSTVGLKADGTVVAVGYNEYGQCNVSDWTDIVAVSRGTCHTVGLKADGTVVAVGENNYDQCDVSDWTDIVAVSAGGFYTVGLRADGTVVAVGNNDDGQCDVSDWTDIVAVSAGDYLTVGLKEDGTVVATGSNLKGECNVSDWKNIVAVSTGYTNLIGTDSYLHPAGLTAGLKADGTVVATGYNEYGQCNVSSWKNIAAVSVGSVHAVGLKLDGTVVATGSNNYGQCDVSDWTDIVAVYAEGFYTVGLRADGTVVATGDNAYGECDVSGWTDIKTPEN